MNAPAGTGISGSFTVEAWARPASPTATLTILSTRNDFGFDMKFQDGNLIHGDIGTASSWLTTTANAAFNYRAGEWYHIAYCVGGGSYEIYVNGLSTCLPYEVQIQLVRTIVGCETAEIMRPAREGAPASAQC